MNKIYKVIWSKVKHQYVVVSELTHSNGKQKSSRSVSLKNSLRGILVAVLAAGSLYINGGIAFAGIDGPQNPQTGMTQQSSDNDITIIIDEDMDLKLDEELAFVFNEKEDNPEDQRETIRDQTGQINFSSTGGTEGTNKQIVISSLGSLNLATDENGKYMFKHNNDNIEEDKKYVYVDPETKEYTYADGTAVPSDERGYYQPVWKPNFTEHILDAGSDVIGNIASSEQVQKNKDGSLTLTKPGEKPGETIKQEFTNKGSLSSVAINGEYYEIPDYALQDGQVAVGETETIYDKDGKSNPVEVQTGATFLKVADRNDPTKSDDVKVDGLVTYNTREDNKGNVTTDYGNITLAGYVEKDENGNIKYDEKGHPIRQGTLITNVKDGTIWKDSKDAVNGSQLYAVDQKVNAGWTAKVGETSINVRPNLENETGKDVLNFEAGDNIKLTPNADENKIKIAADGVVSYDKNTSGGYDTTSVTLGEEGNKYVPVSDDGKTPASGGVKLTNVAYASGNDKSEAVNVDYLEKYVDKNGGGSWNITANKNDENATSIGKGNTVDFSGDDNITVAKTDKADKSGADITVNLNDNITLGEGENQIQLNGAPKDDDTPAISVGNNFAVNHDGSITSTVANNAGGGAKADATFNFDEHGLSVKDNVGKTSTLIDGGTITVRNALDNQTVINGKAITAGDIKLNSENNASTMVGLSNTTWENNETWQNEHVVDNRAATEGQLKQAINNLETSTTGNEKHIATAADGEAHPQGGYTVDKEDHTVTLTEVDGNGKATGNNVVISGIASSDEVGDLNYSKVVNEGDDLTINDDDSVTLAIGKLDDRVINNTNNITKLQGQTIDGGYVKDGTINLTHNNGEGVDPSVIASVDGLEDYTLQDGQIITKETKIDADGNKVYTGATELTLADRYDPTKTQKVTIDGLVTYNTKSLKDDDGKVTTGIDYDNITLAGKNGTRIVNVTDGWIDEKSTDAVNGSQLWETQQQIKDVAGKHTTMTVNGGMTAPEDGSYTHDEEGRLDGNLLLKQSEGTNGQTVYDLKLNPDITLQSEDDKLETQDNRVELSGSNGTIMATTDFNDMSATTTINGGNVYVGNSVSVGDKVVMTNEDITGLSNTNWDGTTDNVSRAATEGQLKTVSDTVNAGWTATDSDGKSIVVNPENGSTLNFAGDRNIDVKANEDNKSIDVSLSDDVVLGGKEGTSRVEIGGTNGTIMATKDPNSMAATTTIDGGNVYVGSSISVGDKVEITDKDITGLSNTSWNGTTDDESRAATEGQLKDVSDTVNAGWTATDSDGKSIVVNPENGSTLNFAGDRNIDVKANEDNKSIDVSLSDDVVLGGKEGTSRVEIGGTNGTIMATKDPNSMAATTTIDGGNVYVGSSISVGDKVEITDKDITGLSNTSWNGTTDDESRAATEGQLKDVSDTVNAGWTATDSDGKSIVVNPENGSTLNFAGDRNIDVKANEDNKSIDVSLSDDVVLGGKEGTSRVEIGGTNGTIMATKDPNSMAATTTIDGGNVYVGSSISVGDKVEITDKDITGLSNTSWNGTTDDESRAATEGQLKDVSDTVNAGWTATDSDGKSIVVNPENGSTLNFAGDRNIDVKANEDNKSIDVSLSDDVVLGGKEGTSRVEIGGTNGTIMATKDPNSMAATTTIDGGNIYAGTSVSVGANDDVVITDKDITGLSNTTWDGSTNDISRAATEGQLKAVSDTVNAGWIATDSQNHEVKITPDNNKLNFAGDENVTVTAANNEIKVALDDDIVLGEYLNNGAGVLIGGSSGTISATNSITVGEDQGLIIDGQKKEIQGLSNTTWNEKIANDAAVEGSTAASTAATQGQLQEVSKVANAGWTASDGTNSISVKPNETLNFVGDENLTVSADGTDKELKVALKDDITLKGDSSSIELTGTKGTIQVNQETAEGTNFTNINGNVVSIGYTNSEGIENAIVIDGGKGTITGLSNTTWDDELATQVANSEELQGTAATQGQLQQAVSEVAEVANAGWNAKAGGNTINVKPNETLNFEGDGNITVSATGGTSNELKFGLNDDITLGNPKAGNTEGERSFTINTTAPEGYVPDSYKEENSSGAEFIKENGGFMLFATDTQGHGIFGVTAKGSAWAKDFKTYTTDIYGNNTQYSLNDVGDAVAQMSSYYNKENGKSYTVFSRYLNEAEKDNPFATVDENATRDIPLALRDDGAVLIGATIKGDDFIDNGIRINAETETTYDGDGNEVTNNIATITGLENTEWKPPTPVATLAANDINTTSRAATEAQLDDLYSAVAAYDVNVDGTIDYSHIALAGAPYGASRAGNGTPTGGTSITNVAYASGKDGSEAVNVDYLNDAISDAAENGSISTSDQHLVANTETGSNGVYKPNDDGNVNLIVSDEKGNSSTITIGDVASKEDLDNLKDDVGDLDYSKVEGDTIIDGDSVTDAIGKLDNKIENISGTATDADNNTVTGGKINSDGTISLTQKDKDSIKLEGQLTDSGVVQEGTSFDKETGTITITSQDKYSGETSSVKVEGIASTEVVGATNKEDLATAYKDADKDGNATTEYITDSESMVEADVALDHAIQDVAGTSYANDMVLSNRIDSVEKRLGNVEERIDKVGAMAAAIANLRTMGFDPEAPTEIAIGVGQYKSETGIAIGVFHYPNQDFMLSASLSSSGDELMGGIGATWKLGRKSAAERAKDEEARHLEQAEEMKKLAQQEKVKAQAQRHAKLLAERQQASQKNA